mgnify:FL=1
MGIKEFDVVKLDDGRKGTILEVFEQGAAFCVEIPEEQSGSYTWEIIRKEQIKSVLYRA